MAFLLDTNVCIDFTLGRSAMLLARVRARRSDGLGVSAITFAELAVGARGEDATADAEKLARLTRIIRVEVFDQAAAGAYGRLVAEIGIKRHSFDRLIAAHALCLGFTLVTNNERDFADIPGLRVENWAI